MEIMERIIARLQLAANSDDIGVFLGNCYQSLSTSEQIAAAMICDRMDMLKGLYAEPALARERLNSWLPLVEDYIEKFGLRTDIHIHSSGEWRKRRIEGLDAELNKSKQRTEELEREISWLKEED